MSWNIFPERVMRLLEQTLTWRSRRQEIIAGNIANLDTPRYTRKELNFQKLLAAHLQGVPLVRLAATHAAHLTGKPAGAAGAVENTRSSVDLDQEMVQMAENQLGYQASVLMLNKKIDQIRSVLQGDRS
jgi:flagellar basal-body rod protein FlgB